VKRKIFLSIAFVALVSIIIFFVNKRSYPDLYLPMPGEEVPHVTYTLKANTFNLPEQMLIYKFVRPDNPLAQVNEISDIFGIKGEVKAERNKWLFCKKRK
jgi:hypothetical protein